MKPVKHVWLDGIKPAFIWDTGVLWISRFYYFTKSSIFLQDKSIITEWFNLPRGKWGRIGAAGRDKN
jgi:hypothetical protein